MKVKIDNEWYTVRWIVCDAGAGARCVPVDKVQELTTKEE